MQSAVMPRSLQYMHVVRPSVRTPLQWRTQDFATEGA